MGTRFDVCKRRVRTVFKQVTGVIARCVVHFYYNRQMALDMTRRWRYRNHRVVFDADNTDTQKRT